MIEPEMAFCNLEGDMDLAEDFIQISCQGRPWITTRAISSIFAKISSTRASVHRLEGAGLRVRFRPHELHRKRSRSSSIGSGKSFDYPVEWGVNLQSEHERYLCEEVVKGPLTVYNYPKSIKPFYMRTNDDGKTVTAMDVLVPGVGEIIGGSQREERYDLLKAEMEANDLSLENYGWYLDLRKYGTVPHAGFGAGFERLLMYVTGMQNIRDVIPFARTPGNCDF